MTNKEGSSHAQGVDSVSSKPLLRVIEDSCGMTRVDVINSVVFEDLEAVILMLDTACLSRIYTPAHHAVIKKFKSQCLRFSQDMLLAGGDRQEIVRRLGLADQVEFVRRPNTGSLVETEKTRFKHHSAPSLGENNA